MPYSKLLSKVIAESGYTATQIVEECNKRGKSVDKAYISKLVNGKVPPPREELSRMLANICNVNEKILVLEGYIDKAPKEILEAFNSIRNKINYYGMRAFDNVLSEEHCKVLQNEMEKEPIAEFILELINIKDEKIKITEDIIELPITEKELADMLKGKKIDEVKISINEPISITVKDNGMFPIVPEKSKVILEIKKEYQDAEILAIKIKNKDDFVVRYVLFKDNEIILKPLNKEYYTEKYDKNDVIILGKVKKVIMDI